MGKNRKNCKNCWTDWDAVWVLDSDGPKQSCFRWGLDHPWEGAILGERGAHCKVQRLSAGSCAKTAEPIDFPFGCGLGVSNKAQVQSYSQGGANWSVKCGIESPTWLCGRTGVLRHWEYFDKILVLSEVVYLWYWHKGNCSLYAMTLLPGFRSGLKKGWGHATG